MAPTFRQFVAESINDAGIFKAIFLAGIPGAGKSYAVTKLKGPIAPRVVNTDRASELLAKRLGRHVTPADWDLIFRDRVHQLTKAALFNYLNGMLPLFIDGTSNDAANLLHRVGILESIGYDVGMVYLDTPLEVAKERVRRRASAIGREVSPEFIERVYATLPEHVAFYRNKFQFFLELSGTAELNDAALQQAFEQTNAFFSAPVRNPLGRLTIEQLRAAGERYLIPTILSGEALEKKLAGWYHG